MTRCFLGFEFQPASLDYLREQVAPLHRRLSQELSWPVRLVRPENWHLTLLFFEELAGGERAEVWKAVERGAGEGAWRELAVEWQGLAVWPSPRRPSLICLEAGLYPGAAAWPLPVCEAPFSKAKVRDYRAFRPHITLMRFNRRRPMGREWRGIQDELPRFDPERIAFDRLSFFLSTLSPEQPIYPREFTVSLR